MELAAILAGYILGSIPAPYWIARLRKGIDIRTVGVRNMGAANVIREVGIWEGALAAIIDVGKGALAVWVAQLIGVSEYWTWAAGFAAILGHNFPVFLKFRGGRGAATFIGVMAFIAPAVTGIGLAVFATLWLIIRHTLTALLITAPVFLAVAWVLEKSPALMVFTAVAMLLIIFQAKYRMGEVKTALGRMSSRNKSAVI